MPALPTTFLGFDRGARGVGVRDLVLVLPSVGCSNRAVEHVGAARPEVRVITHQHGCGQLGSDLAVTSATLAGVLANPNVRAGLIVGLGCESNVPVRLAAEAAALGADVRHTVLQVNGGIDPTVAASARLLDEVPPAADRVEVPVSSLVVGVLADVASGAEGAAVASAVAAALRAAGVRVIDAGVVGGPGGLDRPIRAVHDAWAGHDALVAGTDVATLVADSEVEQLAVFAAAGAHVAVFVTGRGNPVGSPVVPTVKVTTDPAWDFVADAVVERADDADCVDAVARLVVDVAGGRETAAELAGQRDFGIPRIAPTM